MRWAIRNRLLVNVAFFVATAMWCDGASAYTYRVIHDFCSNRACKDGNNPQAGLIMDVGGNLYGTTALGGKKNSGVVFELAPNPGHDSWKSKTLHQFCSPCTSDGTEPEGRLVVDTAGNLYGTTYRDGRGGAGTVFELLPNGTRSNRILKTLASFSFNDDAGANPIAGLSYQGAASGLPFDGSSPLYGTLQQGAFLNNGAVFQLTPSGDTWTSNTIYRFCPAGGDCPDGANPIAGVLLDSSGNVYGTTPRGGGPIGGGTIFELTNSGDTWTQTVLWTFCHEKDCRDGGGALSTPFRDPLGNLYGSTFGGGNRKHAGVVFRLAPDGTYNPLYDFCTLQNCRDGVSRSANLPTDLIADSTGQLYGVTMAGGGHNGDFYHLGGGTVFAWNGTTLQTLYSFCAQLNCTDGEYPVGGLVMDADGNLFGVTQAGGKYDAGVVFELTP